MPICNLSKCPHDENYSSRIRYGSFLIAVEAAMTAKVVNVTVV